MKEPKPLFTHGTDFNPSLFSNAKTLKDHRDHFKTLYGSRKYRLLECSKHPCASYGVWFQYEIGGHLSWKRDGYLFPSF